MRSSLIYTSNQEPYSIRSFPISLAAYLPLLHQLSDESFGFDRRAISVLVRETLVSHEFADKSRVGSESGYTNSDVAIDFEYFLLMICEI